LPELPLPRMQNLITIRQLQASCSASATVFPAAD
jgi:hypothetical protein